MLPATWPPLVPDIVVAPQGVAADAADAAAVARRYVGERRKEIRMLKDHSYTQADAIAATMDSPKLDSSCSAS